MLEFPSKLHGQTQNLSVLVTSRGEIDIEDSLRSYSKLRFEDQGVQVDKNIQAYINRRLATDASFKKLSETTKLEIRLKLVKKSAGMFHWAQCQLDTFSRLRTVKAIRMSLTRLSKTLNETYEKILKKTHEEDIELLHRILLWTAFTVLPLTLEELREAVAIESGAFTLDTIEESRLNDPNDILSIAGSLLSVSESGHVRLAHLSVKDYLLSDEIKQVPEICSYSMNLEEANQELAIIFLTYLSLDSLAGGPVEPREDWECRLSDHPLLKRAAKGWTYYLRAKLPAT